MRKQFITACLYTLVTTILLGLGYPLAVTVLAHLLMPANANGDLITQKGVIVGSKFIGQPFTGPGYFNSRPSAAGAGYDGANSSGSNLGPSNATLIARVEQSVQFWKSREAKAGNRNQNVPVDLVTTSGSGLDPDITVAAAEYQVPSVAEARGLPGDQVKHLVHTYIEPRQFGFLGEPRVNVLELNLALDASSRRPAQHQ
ncbi:MAG TPA: potassium-transporting ATPase subunit KdpC [Acidobacteriaceae bacterium]|nr:potassium-transporting ATPase subunit KdpC [Acidobacteriaceae bacterium]